MIKSRVRNLKFESLSVVTMSDSSIRWSNGLIFLFLFSVCKIEILISASFVECVEVTGLILHFFDLSVNTLNLYQVNQTQYIIFGVLHSSCCHINCVPHLCPMVKYIPRKMSSLWKWGQHKKKQMNKHFLLPSLIV